MKSRLGLLAVLVLFVQAAGCTMCQAPFDYCNPAIGPSGFLNCDFGARRGSVFHPMEDDPLPTQTGAEQTPGPIAVESTEYVEETPGEVEPASEPQVAPSLPRQRAASRTGWRR